MHMPGTQCRLHKPTQDRTTQLAPLTGPTITEPTGVEAIDCVYYNLQHRKFI